MGKRRRYRGHFCWCCSRVKPNEQFSGRGHAHHVCKRCSTLGREELAFRQHARNIDRAVSASGLIVRKLRTSFERFLSHPDPRVREYAEKVAVSDLRRREEFRQERLAWESAERST
jgi:hypothetical protein